MYVYIINGIIDALYGVLLCAITLRKNMDSSLDDARKKGRERERKREIWTEKQQCAFDDEIAVFRNCKLEVGICYFEK